MLRKYLGLVVCLTLFATAARAQDARVLPRNMTPEEKAAILNEPVTPGPGVYIWECFPELAGFTDTPPPESRFPTEAEQTRGAMYGWPSYGALMSPLTELIRNSVQQDGYETNVMVPAAFRFSAESTLRSRGFDDTMIGRINWFITPLDGIWIRDYGGIVLTNPTDGLEVVDMGYYSGQGAVCPASPEDPPRLPGRPSDDVSPTRFAPSFPDFGDGIPTFRPPLRTEGGNLQTDGAGTCFHMQRDVLLQNNFSRWMYSQTELDDVYRSYFNCANVITLESLHQDPGGPPLGQLQVIDHVDMWMTVISKRTDTNPGTIIVARLDPEDAAIDPTNAAVLERNAQTLIDAGYNVVRIPQPARYCTLRRGGTCIANAGDTRECVGSVDRVWATYANSMRIGNRMLVPIYRDPVDDSSPLSQDVKDRIMRQEAEALATFQSALDADYGVGAVQVVPVVSDDMIPCQGSMHCITMTYSDPKALPISR